MSMPIHDGPAVEWFTPRKLGPKDWGTEVLVAHTEQYTGKVLTMNPGSEGPLQYHVNKDETSHIYEGTAWVDVLIGDNLVRKQLRTGESIHIPPGAVHRVGTITGCVIFEASTPSFDDRVPFEEPR
jgi:mannose-6-phosphate isomerase